MFFFRWLSGYKHQFQSQQAGLVQSGSIKRIDTVSPSSPTKSSSSASSGTAGNKTKRGKSPSSKSVSSHHQKESPKSIHLNNNSESDSNSATFYHIPPPPIALVPSNSSATSSSRSIPRKGAQQYQRKMDEESVPTVIDTVERIRYSTAPRKSADAPSASRPLFEEEKARAQSMDQSRSHIHPSNGLGNSFYFLYHFFNII